MRRLLVLAATLALAASADAAAPSQPAQQAQPQPQHLVYNVSRNGSPIGQNILDIDKKGAVTSINMASDIDVKVLFVTAYTYHYNGSETWADGQLTAFTSRTDDNGTTHSIAAHPDGDRLDVDADGHRSAFVKTIGLDDFWCPQLLTKQTVLDTSDGHKMTFVAQDLGMETVSYRGAPRPARHFKLTGEINRDLWFDAETPVRFQIKGRDGSMIVSELK